MSVRYDWRGGFENAEANGFHAEAPAEAVLFRSLWVHAEGARVLALR